MNRFRKAANAGLNRLEAIRGIKVTEAWLWNVALQRHALQLSEQHPRDGDD